MEDKDCVLLFADAGNSKVAPIAVVKCLEDAKNLMKNLFLKKRSLI